MTREPDLGFIHRFDRGSGTRTLLLLHGTGGNEDDLIGLGRYVVPDANLLSPRGKVLENGMPRFFRRLAMGVFDVEDLRLRTHELARFVETAIRHYDLDPSETGLLGYSNGANIGASLLLLEPGVVQRAALLHAMVPFEVTSQPDLTGVSVLLTGGERDPMIPKDQTTALATMLVDAGASVDMKLFPGGHEVSQGEIDLARTWLTTSVGPLQGRS